MSVRAKMQELGFSAADVDTEINRQRAYTMDGEPLILREFREANAEDPECAGWLEQIEALRPGESLLLGGGAGEEVVIACVRPWSMDDEPSPTLTAGDIPSLANLNELRNAMLRHDPSVLDQHGQWRTDLPTFGGPDVLDTTAIWSWDSENVLRGTCADDLRIEPREEE